MKLGLPHLIAGSAAFVASVYSGYWYAKPAMLLPQGPGNGQADGCAFDRLANVYDSIIGTEETYMFYGLLRGWLLRKAQGEVLEISTGTGRNLPQYSFANLQSLTLTDISQPMLQQAEKKYFDMQLQYKQPNVKVKFLLADAEHMVAADGQPVSITLPPSSRRSLPPTPGITRQDVDHGITESSNQQSNSIWRSKKQRQQQQQGIDLTDLQAAQDSSSSSSSSPTAEQSSPTMEAYGTMSSSQEDCSRKSWWRKPLQPCSCEHGATSSSTGVSSSSSSTGSIQGSTFTPGSFDVVVDTFGLCSCEDPVQVLQQAAQLLRPGGKLLLLEHGRSTWGWLNEYMDKQAARHYKVYGCWYNRDILDIVHRAGLQIESSSRWHFGTSYMIVATPAAAAALSMKAAGTAAAET